MTSSLDLIRGRQVVQTLTNKSGGGVIAGDVVIIDTANDESFTTTTTAAYNATQVCIALDTIAANASGRVLLQGYAPLVNVSASATRGYYLLTHTVAKQATSGASFATGTFGQVLKAGTTPSAYIFPPAIGSTAGITRSGSTADGNIAAWNGSNADSLKDGGAIAIARIGQSVAGVGGASFLEIGSIPATYSSLRIECYGKCDSSSTAQAINLTFNGDGGNNYDREVLTLFASTASAGEALAGANLQVANFSDSTGPANAADQVVIDVSGYANTTFQKTLIAHATAKLSTASGGVRMNITTGWWRSTSAITTVRLTPGSGKFLQGSTMTVWGLY